MKLEDFEIGSEFYTGSGRWRCTDVGTRVIVAIRIDQVTVSRHVGGSAPTTEIISDDQSWFNGPPYAVSEQVFDEHDVGGCSMEPEVAK